MNIEDNWCLWKINVCFN